MLVSAVEPRAEGRACSRCVMDTTDPDIKFDARGVCNHCHEYDHRVASRVFDGNKGQAYLSWLIKRIQREGRNKEYDCVIGVSGGVDSTFAAYKVKELGLRPLAVHLDNGWDSELAVKNIEQVLKKLDIELHTYVIDWAEFRDLQLAFLKASTPDSEIPTDHAIVAILFQTAEEIGVRYILSGVNQRTESHLPKAWSTGHLDWKYIRSVHHRFGTKPLKTFPRQGLWTLVRDRFRIQWIDILNYVNYSKRTAMEVLQKDLGWRYYGGKHYESIYTRFYQGYILPTKFGFDKRKSHLSSLICSGEMSRAEAMRELEKEPYPAELQVSDREYVIKKLGLTTAEFDEIMNRPVRRFEDYPSYYKSPVFRTLKAIYRWIRA